MQWVPGYARSRLCAAAGSGAGPLGPQQGARGRPGPRPSAGDPSSPRQLRRTCRPAHPASARDLSACGAQAGAPSHRALERIPAGARHFSARADLPARCTSWGLVKRALDCGSVSGLITGRARLCRTRLLWSIFVRARSRPAWSKIGVIGRTGAGRPSVSPRWPALVGQPCPHGGLFASPGVQVRCAMDVAVGIAWFNTKL